MTVRFSYVRIALRVCSLPRNTDYDAVKYPIFLRATTYRDITSSTAVTPGENRCPVGVCCVTESINALPICEKRELHDCPINKSNGRTVGYAVSDTGLHRYHARSPPESNVSGESSYLGVACVGAANTGF